MIEEIKSALNIDSLPEGCDTNRLEELWSNEETKPFALRHVSHFLNN